MTSCPTCTEPLPDKAKFCPTCGTATPQGINPATAEVHAAPKPPAPEEGADHRDRLQRALGDGLKIRRLLGRGGFAEVWSAFDVRLKREVAVKTVRYDLVISDTLLERFQREAEAVAKLRHPNIIPIYEVGEGEGIAYFVMPMIEGESLGEALDREGSFSVDEACRILREAAGALAAAHRAGIVHRDIKPDNIMLEGPERRPIVMDFGIAKATTGGDSRLTGTGMAMGTPHYMSPEQASGEKDLDSRSDQYALALVGYRMLAGQLPFQADTMSTLIMKQITEVPKPLITVRPDVPRELSDALARALSKDPASRFNTMEEFAAAIPHMGQGPASASRRRRPTSTELARFPGALMPSLREPVVLLGALGVIASIALFAPSSPRAAVATAAKRGEALFIGRAFLTKHGATGSYDERLTLAHDDTAYIWLQRAVGTNAADQQTLKDGAAFRWNLRWQRIGGSSDGVETWNVGVAPNGRVVRFNAPIPDSVARKTIPVDSAARVAESFLRDAGYDVAALTRVQDSILPRGNGSDRVFIWDARGAQIVNARGDTAMPRARVTISGDRVWSFTSSLHVPPAFVREVRTGPWRNITIASVFIIMTVIVIAAIVLAVQRQRTDELQWKLGAGLAAVALLGIGIPLLLDSANGNADGSVGALAAGFLFIGVFMLFGLQFGAVSGESLANEVNPRGLVGFTSLAKLRASGPEWTPALLRGLAIGGILAAISTVGKLVATKLFWRGGSVPDGVSSTVPWTLPLTDFGTALAGSILIFFVVHFLAKYTKRPWLAILVPAVFVAFIGIDPTLRPWLFAISQGGSFAISCWTIWRYGFLTGVVASLVADLLPGAIALLAVGNDSYLTAGSICIVVLLAIPVLALLRRRRTTTGG
jgi:hypothetical protein